MTVLEPAAEPDDTADKKVQKEQKNKYGNEHVPLATFFNHFPTAECNIKLLKIKLIHRFSKWTIEQGLAGRLLRIHAVT